MKKLRFLLTGFAGLIFTLSTGLAQDLPSKKEIGEQMKAVEAGKEASTQKAEALRLYKKALDDLTAAEAFLGKAAEFKREVEAAPQKEADLTKEIAAGAKRVQVEAPKGASVETLRLRLSQAEAARRDLDQLLASYDSIKEGDEARIKKIQARSTELESLIRDKSAALSKAEVQQGIVEKASRVAALCELESLRQERAELDRERVALESRVHLLPKQRSAVLLRRETAQAVEKAWRSLVRKAIEEESTKSAEKAKVLKQQAIVQRFEDLKKLSEQNESWARERGERLAPELQAASEEARALKTRHVRLLRRFESLHQMIRDVGLNNSTVELIRKEEEALPSVDHLSKQRAKSRARVAQVLLKEYQVERVLEEADRSQEVRIREIVARHEDDVSGLDALLLQAAARSLIQEQDGLAQKISKDLSTLRTRIWRLDREITNLIQTTRSFDAYLQERVLWVPSIPRDRLFNPKGLGDASAWLFDLSNWTEAGGLAWNELWEQWADHRLPFLLLLILLVAGPMLRRRLEALGVLVRNPRADRYRFTWEAVLVTVLLALPLPLLFLGLESLFLGSAEKGSFGAGIGQSLSRINTLLLMLSVTIQALRPGGLCEVHFRWNAEGVATLRKQVRRFVWLVLPLFVLSGLVNASGNESWKDSLGRLLFALAVGLYSLLLFQVLRPSSQLLGPFLQQNPDRWYARQARLWYVLIAGVPLIFIALAFFGYFLTARRLATNFHDTLWAFLLSLAAYLLAMRWVRLSVKRARLREADEQRAELEQEDETGDLSPETEPDHAAMDLEAVRSRTSQLFRAMGVVAFLIALLSIWAGVLPAIKMFDRIQLLPRPAILEETLDPGLGGPAQGPSDPGTPEVAKEESRKKTSPSNPMTPALPMPETQASVSQAGAAPSHATLTLGQLLLFLVSLGFTVIAVRNVPTLVEIVLLRQRRIDAGARIAFKTLTQYLVLSIGITSMAGVLGIGWADLQWLVAALTFGLAFGLQEIFANFISGIILLFERPIRIGDIVTIGQTSGVVSRVRLRATVIRDFDKKELLVPNKEFITTRLINWTLSDTVVRVKLPIAVTLDSDVPRVRGILEEVAAAADDTLEDPPPRILCTGLDEGLLRFEIWLFTNDRTNRPGLKDKLYCLVRSRFEQEGIQIAKPQGEFTIHTDPGGDR